MFTYYCTGAWMFFFAFLKDPAGAGTALKKAAPSDQKLGSGTDYGTYLTNNVYFLVNLAW